MKKVLFLIFIGLFLTACQTSSLSIDKSKALNLHYNSEQLVVADKILSNNYINYKDLYVQQYKMQDDGATLFYEALKTDLSYEFNYTGLYSVMLIFDDAKEYEIIYRRNNLVFLQLKLKSKLIVNIMYQFSDTQILSYTYGFTNAKFKSMIQKIKDTDDAVILAYEATTITKATKALTNWNDEMVYFAPLITPLRVKGMN